MDKQSKILIGVLCFLATTVIGLVAGLIVVANNNANNTVADTDSSEIPAGCEFNEEKGEVYCEDIPYKRIAQEDELVNEYHAARNEIVDLLNQEPVDVNQINAIYSKIMDKALEYDRADYVVWLANKRYDDFMGKGLKREALDAFSTIDFSLFSESNQYRLYTKAIELAKELNDSTALSKYENLRAGVEEVYLRESRESKAAQERAEATRDPEGREITEIEEGT